MIVGEPFADPQPFMGPVIDNAAADHVQEQWLNLMMKGGKPLRRLDRPIEDQPFLTPGADRRHRRQGPARRGNFRARPAGHPGQGFRRGDRGSEQHPLRPRREPDRRQPEMYDKFWANVRAGVINWNKPTNGAPSNAPFGGIGLSGNHRPSAFYAADYCAYPVTSSEADRVRAQPSAKACATRTCRKTDARQCATACGSLCGISLAFSPPMSNKQLDRHGPRPCPVQRRPSPPARQDARSNQNAADAARSRRASTDAWKSARTEKAASRCDRRCARATASSPTCS